MLRTLGIWIIAAAAVMSVVLQLEEREDRADLVNEQRYQSCMAQNIGSGTNLLLLEAALPNEQSVPPGRSVQLDESIGRCRRAFPHTTTPTTAR